MNNAEGNIRLLPYLLHLADNTLILSQRNAAWCGHGPVLEQDIAITNISLDLLGQSRNFYQYAATLENQQSKNGSIVTEDSLAYLRKEQEFRNCLLVELPNGDWGQTVLRQFFFSAFQYLLYQKLKEHKDEQLAAIAAKSLKEVIYHQRWSSEWVIRLGDGTNESHRRMEHALSELWPYTGELFMPVGFELVGGVDVSLFQLDWEANIKSVLEEATLQMPSGVYMQRGGKEGKHTEYLGYILTELQYMQRTYPGCEW